MDWAASKGILNRHLTSAFGENVRHVPSVKTNVNAAAQPQDDLAYDFCAIFDDPAEHEDLQSKQRSNGHRYVQHSTSCPYISVDICHLEHDVRQGDRMVLLDRSETYEVTDKLRDMDGRMQIFLVRLGRHRAS